MEAKNLEMVRVGQVINTQGVKGEVKIWPLTSSLERFQQLSRVFIETVPMAWPAEKGKALTIDKIRFQKGLPIVKFHQLTSMTDAEKLQEVYLVIPVEEVPPPEADTYYHFQLIGLDVWEASGEHLGRLVKIIETGSNDVYVVEKLGDEGQQEELLIPALKSVVQEVDLDSKRMTVILPDGLR